MPAIHLAQLKLRCAQLAELFGQPDRFLDELQKLLNFYADRTQRPGQSGEPPPLLPSFNVPKPVIRQLTIELSPLVVEYPEDALKLSDALWIQPYFEFRYLAAYLLSQVPMESADHILERVVRWSDTLPEVRLLTALMELGTKRLRLDAPEALIQQIEIWISDADPRRQKTGLNALIPLITSGDYEDLPVFYRLLAPLARNIPEDLREDIRDAMIALARRSPIETAYYLGQYMETTDSQDSAWLARQCMSLFPKQSQENLRWRLRMSPLTDKNPRRDQP
jgi:hypothetical protein